MSLLGNRALKSMGMESLLYPGGPPPPRPMGVMSGPPNPRLAAFGEAVSNPQTYGFSSNMPIGGLLGEVAKPANIWAHKTGYGQETSLLENMGAAGFLQDVNPAGLLAKGVVKYGIPALGAAGLLGMMGRKVEPSVMSRMYPKQAGMVGWHGSPHEFEAFDFSKMGTGEGAQAYGWGGYIAGNKGVGEGYQKALTTPKATVDGSEVAYSPASNSAESVALGAVGFKGYDESLAHADTMLAEGVDPAYVAKYKEAVSALKGKQVKVDDGYLYEVDLPDEKISQMLDWDKPLSEQPENVKAYFQSYVDEFNASSQSDGWGSLADEAPEFNPSGSELYAMMQDQPIEVMGGAGQREASLKLGEAGIPGIKYFDGSSRSAGEGTRNFVVFDEATAKITKRNDKPVGGLLSD